jgi:TrmH family RNA methyltransferase
MANLITSTANPRIKQIRVLRMRKERNESGMFTASGLQTIMAALQAQAEIMQVVAAPDLLDIPPAAALLRELERHAIPCLYVAPQVFESLGAGETAHGLLVTARQRWERLEEIAPAAEDCWIVLEQAQYPGNLGTTLRTLEAVGGAGMILIGPTADPYDPAAVQASTGAVFTRRLVRATAAEFACWKRHTGIHTIGTALQASGDHWQAAYPRPLAILMGGERYGLSEELRACCDTLVRIPMLGTCDSLNLAVAAGVILYEALRGRT